MAGAATVGPILEGDAEAASRFLHEHLNPRVSTEAWARLFRPPWADPGADRGYQLRVGGDLVGVYAAVRSMRSVRGEEVPVCNLAAFCVLEPHRAHSLRLVRAMLAQRNVEFTDLSPSGNVIGMNERLGFRRVDARTRLVANLPAGTPRGVTITDDPDAIASALTGDAARVHADHRDTAAARHLVVQRGGDAAYLMYRRERRKRLPVFASTLYAGGDRRLLAEAWGAVRAHLLRRGHALTLAEHRVLGFEPAGPGTELRSPRVRMVKGGRLRDEDVDAAYSEFPLVAW